MTIVVHAAGDGNIGVGHFSRTRSLICALIAAGQTVNVVYEGDERLINRYHIDGACYFHVTNRNEALCIRATLVQRNYGSIPVLITDLLNLNEKDASEARAQGFQLLVHLNDSGIPAYCPDIWVNGDAFAVANNDLPANTLQLLGANYHIIQPSVVQKRTVPWNLPKVEKVLISMGGADPDKMTELILERLKIVDTCEFTIVIGPVFTIERKEQLQATRFPHIHFIVDVFDLSELMNTHDLIITLGGISSYEAMCLGRPVAAIEWKYLKPYVAGLHDMGMLTSLGEAEQASNRLQELITEPVCLASKASKAWHLVDGQGAARVADAVLNFKKVEVR